MSVSARNYDEFDNLDNINKVGQDIKEEQWFSSLSRDTLSNRRLYDLGRDCFFNPELMEGLDEETTKSNAFVAGYNHGKRLALIEEMEKKNGKKR